MNTEQLRALVEKYRLHPEEPTSRIERVARWDTLALKLASLDLLLITSRWLSFQIWGYETATAAVGYVGNLLIASAIAILSFASVLAYTAAIYAKLTIESTRLEEQW